MKIWKFIDIYKKPFCITSKDLESIRVQLRLSQDPWRNAEHFEYVSEGNVNLLSFHRDLTDKMWRKVAALWTTFANKMKDLYI